MSIKSVYRSTKSRTVSFFKKQPLITFAAVLIVLFVLIAVGNALREPQVETVAEEPQAKVVRTYQVGSVPKIAVSAKIEKSGVITITSQTSGIVRSLPVEAGDTIKAGTTVVGLASNYTGGNVPTKQRQLAAAEYRFKKDNYDEQTELINQQKRAAELTADDKEKLREISERSIDSTRTIIDNSEENLKLLESMIEYYRNNVKTNTLSDQATDEVTLLGLEQQRVGILNALQTARQGLASTEYSTDEDEAAVQTTQLNKEMALKRLELEQKSLQLGLETSKLSLQIAQINESAMYPAAPFAGTVERVHVKVGEAVSPGTPLVTFSGAENSVTAVALVSQQIAEQVSRLEPSLATINNTSFEVYPSYVSTEATANRLFSITYPIMLASPVGEKGYDADLFSTLNVADGQFITIELPIGYSNSTSSFPFLPLDAIYQTQDTAYIFVVEDGRAVSKELTLGSIFGRYIEVTSGLSGSDQVILDRTVLAGDPVVQK